MTHYHASPHALSDIITLWPHRSLSQRGFLIVMTAIATLCFIVGTGFFLLGAWPVIGFLGLEFVAVYLAFHYNYRAARAHEQLLIHEKRGGYYPRLSKRVPRTCDITVTLADGRSDQGARAPAQFGFAISPRLYRDWQLSASY